MEIVNRKERRNISPYLKYKLVHTYKSQLANIPLSFQYLFYLFKLVFFSSLLCREFVSLILKTLIDSYYQQIPKEARISDYSFKTFIFY